ncbi:MAG: helix-turn-helix domain-containing protein [Myxococcota bacterium]
MARLSPFGRLVRYWRTSRGWSQESLAARAGMSTRHLSCVETGRAQPSRDTVHIIAESLEVKDRSSFLEAAGFIAPYPPLAEDDKKALVTEVNDLVAKQPTPALAHDRLGTIVAANGQVRALIATFPGVPLSLNEFGGGRRLLDGLEPFMTERTRTLLRETYRDRVFAELIRGRDEVEEEGLEALRRLWGPRENTTSPPRRGRGAHLSIELANGGQRIALSSFTLTLGLPQDIPYRNYRIMLFFPADEATASILERLHRPL